MQKLCENGDKRYICLINNERRLGSVSLSNSLEVIWGILTYLSRPLRLCGSHQLTLSILVVVRRPIHLLIADEN